MTTAITQNVDVIIYIEGSGESYTVRYEFRNTLNLDTNGIAARLRKSFSLGGSISDAFSELGILRKAELMKRIFRNEYGLEAVVVDLIIR